MAKLKAKERTAYPHRRIIGEAVRLHRKQAKLTQEELAESVNLNPKYVGEVERGEKIISIEALLRISRVVRTPIREFFRDL